MIGFLRQWIEHRRAVRRRWWEDARIKPRAEMDFEVVKAIADQESAGRR